MPSLAFDLATIDGTNGFRVTATPSYDPLFPAAAGDVNGDGLADLLIGDPGNGSSSSAIFSYAYVVYGTAAATAPDVSLGNLDGTNGFRVVGPVFAPRPDDDRLSRFGETVDGLGDVNGDGVDDFVIGQTGGSNGRAHVIFGRSTFAAEQSSFALTQSGGLVFNSSVSSVSAAGDVNGDGTADILVGGAGADDGVGETYVLTGSSGAIATSPSELNGANGFTYQGTGGGSGDGIQDRLGTVVADLGDVNGDGIDDFAIGVNGEGLTNEFGYHVVFGRDGAFPPAFDRTALNGTNGFFLDAGPGGSGHAISAGDFNGDGFNDIVFNNRAPGAGATVLYGRATFSATVDAASLSPSQGFTTGRSFNSLSGDGDFNGDGFDDILFVGNDDAYLLHGRETSPGASVDLTDLGADEGFEIVSSEGRPYLRGDFLGDTNGDGFDDMVVNGLDTSFGTLSYVVHGDVPDEAVVRIGSIASQTISGGRFGDRLEGRGGDDRLNGGGGNDVLRGDTGDDDLRGGDQNDILFGGEGADIIDGGRGFDFVSYIGAAIGVRIDLLNPSTNTGEAEGDVVVRVENIVGSNNPDYIGAGNVANLIFGRGGGDDIFGEGGDDRIFGEGGNDNIRGGSGDDFIDGGSGRDILNGDRGNDHVVGGADADILIANGGDVLDGGRGVDTVTYARSGSGVTVDMIDPRNNEGAASGDTYFRIENLVGSNFDDVLSGNRVENVIDGRGGDDRIISTGGGLPFTNTIIGGAGADELIGNGSVQEVFVYRSALDSPAEGFDTIRNFTGRAGGDKIDLSAVDADSTIAGNQVLDYIGEDEITLTGQLRYNNQLSRFEADVDGDIAIDFIINTPGVGGTFIPSEDDLILS